MLALSRTVLAHTDISAALLKRKARIVDQYVFNLTLPYTPTPITNQQASGRCWLFASTNVVRYTAAQKLGVADFQLSQVRPSRFFEPTSRSELTQPRSRTSSSGINSRRPTTTSNCALS